MLDNLLKIVVMIHAIVIDAVDPSTGIARVMTFSYNSCTLTEA